jgi:hypothetical protein
MPIPVLCGPYSLLHPDPPRQRGGGAKIVIFNKEVLHAVSKSAVQHPPQMSNEATPYEEDTNLADRRQGIANSFRVSVRYRGSGGAIPSVLGRHWSEIARHHLYLVS